MTPSLPTLRISTPDKEGIYQGSKYLKYQVLCDPAELETLFKEFFHLYRLTGLNDGMPLSQAEFLDEYSRWIEGLKEGKIPTDAQLKKILACAMTADLEALWLQPVPGNRFMTKIAKPLIQIQAHFFTYSSIDGVFRPMSMGPESVFWGLQFSFPQIYQDPKTFELLEVEESINTDLFEKVKRWVRDTTRATPFTIDGKRVNATIRIGKNSLSWAGRHPQLLAKNLGIWEQGTSLCALN